MDDMSDYVLGGREDECLHFRIECSIFGNQRLDDAGVPSPSILLGAHSHVDRNEHRLGRLASLDGHGQASSALHHRYR